jgi:hypothetical protein
MKRVLALGALLAIVAAAPAAAETNVLFVFDASGSMKAKVDASSTRLSVAKKALTETLTGLPADARLGLLLYGHRRAKDCTDIELVSPLGADDAATIGKRVNATDAKGETPIAEALRQGARSFAAFKGQNNRIVLITDGIEECKGDPCAAAKAIKDAGVDLKVDIVGFTLNDAQGKTMQCVTKATGGNYYSATDVKGLTAAMSAVKKEIAAAPPPPPQPAKEGEHDYGKPIHGGDAFDSAVALPAGALYHLDRELPGGKQDFFSVPVKGGQRLTVILTGGKSTNISAEIVNAQRSKLDGQTAFARNKTTAKADFANGMDGTAYVLISAVYGNVGSDSTFQVNLINQYDANTQRDAGSGEASAIAIQNYIYPRSNLNGVDTMDVYKFNAEAGKAYTFKARPGTDDGTIGLAAVDGDGVSLGSGQSPNAGAVAKVENIKLAKGGAVYVKVNYPYGTPGDYSMVLGVGDIPSPPKPAPR